MENPESSDQDDEKTLAPVITAINITEFDEPTTSETSTEETVTEKNEPERTVVDDNKSCEVTVMISKASQKQYDDGGITNRGPASPFGIIN